ncbi:MAG: hypothetical protein BWY81_00202 [Firmicutes bacterium ADurb.Bin467]|nr:MAG: hypothetical protein BWY81_00202 [Firmicutes bacterium ADurb.Bin467]
MPAATFVEPSGRSLKPLTALSSAFFPAVSTYFQPLNTFALESKTTIEMRCPASGALYRSFTSLMNSFTASFSAARRLDFPGKSSRIEPDWSSTSTMSAGTASVTISTLPVV